MSAFQNSNDSAEKNANNNEILIRNTSRERLLNEHKIVTGVIKDCVGSVSQLINWLRHYTKRHECEIVPVTAPETIMHYRNYFGSGIITNRSKTSEWKWLNSCRRLLPQVFWPRSLPEMPAVNTRLQHHTVRTFHQEQFWRTLWDILLRHKPFKESLFLNLI